MRRLEVSTWIGFVAFGMGMTALPAALPFLRGWLHASYATLSWLFVATAVGNTVSYFAANRLVDRLGSRRILPWALSALGSGYLTLGLVPELGVWLMVSPVIGVAGSLIDVGSSRLITALFQPHPASALNRLNVFFGIGAVAGPLAITAALAIGASPTPVLLVIGLASLSGLPLVLGSAAPILPASSGEDSAWAGWRIPWIRRLAWAMLLYIAAEMGFGSWISAFAHQKAHVSTAEAALYPMIYWCGLVVTRVVASTALARWRLEAPLIIGAAAGAGAALLAVLAGSQGLWLMAAAFLLGAALGPAFPAVLALASQRAPGREGVPYAVIYAVVAAGALVVPWGEGQIFERSPDAALLVTPVVLALMAWIMWRDDRLWRAQPVVGGP